MTSEARATVLLVDVTAGPNAGEVIASTSIKNPGPQPVKFQLAYPFSVVDDQNAYRLYAGIVDGDSAWVTPTGQSVDVPQPEITGVKLQLEYRHDLLKGAVTGSITGSGLDPTNPEAYGTALILDLKTGATIGFQLISPTGPVPFPFSVPFDPATIDQGAEYVVRGSVWDGTTLWDSPSGVPVITNDNPKSNVIVTVAPAVTVSPSPTPTATPAPTTPPVPAPAPDSGIGTGTLLLILAIIVLAAVAVYAYMRSKRPAGPVEPAEPPESTGPLAPPPPPGPEPTAPPPPPLAAPGETATAEVTETVQGGAAAEDEGAAQPAEPEPAEPETSAETSTDAPADPEDTATTT